MTVITYFHITYLTQQKQKNLHEMFFLTDLHPKEKEWKSKSKYFSVASLSKKGNKMQDKKKLSGAEEITLVKARWRSVEKTDEG